MALNYDLREVEDWQELDMNRIELMCYLTMIVGIPNIKTDEVTIKFYNRVSAYEKLYGAFCSLGGGKQRIEQRLKLEDIEQFTGLRTNATPQTPAAFRKTLTERLVNDW